MKRDGLVKAYKAFKSPPARGRGLKLNNRNRNNTLAKVAPRTGAWIETV